MKQIVYNQKWCSTLNYTELLDLSDEELCRVSREGESLAEDILATRYLRMVRACARPYFLAGGSSEDLTQEGMLGLLRAIREYDPEKGVPFRSFAEKCIKNRIYSGMRAASRNKHIPLNNYLSIDPLSFDGAASVGITAAGKAYGRSHTDPEELLLDRERYEELLAELNDLLSDFEAEILGLYLEGLSNSEIAGKVGRTPKSVDNAVQRVRRKLERHNNFSDSR